MAPESPPWQSCPTATATADHLQTYIVFLFSIYKFFPLLDTPRINQFYVHFLIFIIKTDITNRAASGPPLLSIMKSDPAIDYEFQNAELWGDDNDGKIPVRTKSKLGAKYGSNAAYATNDQAVQKSRPVTPISRISSTTVPDQSTSLYTSPEFTFQNSKHLPAYTTSRLSVNVPHQGPAIAPTFDPNTSQNRSQNRGNNRSSLSPSNGQSNRYGKPSTSASNGQNRYRNEPQRALDYDRGRRPYTNSTPSAPGSRAQSRPERGSFHRGSDIGGDGLSNRSSAFITPNLYLSDPHSLGLGPDGYEGPDGFLRDNDADRAERAGLPPDSKSLLI